MDFSYGTPKPTKRAITQHSTAIGSGIAFLRSRMAAILDLFKIAAMLVGLLGSTLDAFLCTQP